MEVQSLMVDDTQIPVSGVNETYGPKLFDEMARMSVHKVTRSRARAHVQELFLIVCDDGTRGDTDEAATKLSDNTKSLSLSDLGPSGQHAPDQDHGLKLPEGLRDVAEGSIPVERPQDDNNGENDGDGDLPDDGVRPPLTREHHPRYCKNCRHLPLFPAEKPRKFRVIRSSCSHFLAVSYCWPKDQDGNPIPTSQTYQFRKQGKDGQDKEPATRPPDHIVDRAIEYARVLGIRQIWIDQVCLPQDGSEDHQLGVQALDIVFQRAYMSVGLVEGVIREERLIESLWHALYWNRTGGQFLTEDESVKGAFLDFLKVFTDDQWASRAWILQEAISAGPNMRLLVKTGDDVQWSDSDSLPIPQFIPGSFNIPFDYLGRISSFLQDWAFQSGLPLDRFQEYMTIHKKLNSIYPQVQENKSPLGGTHFVGGTNFGSRLTCNASVAVTYLQNRKNYPVPDRLAVMANLCDYEVRLDTRAMRQFQSLGTAYLTQALMNGDLSLLNPNAYSDTTAKTVDHEYLWCPPFKTILPSVEARQFKPPAWISQRVSQMYHISSEGYKCPAYIWDVKDKIDLTRVQEKWQSKWESLHAFDITVNRVENESEEAYRNRVDRLHDYVRARSEGVATATPEEMLRALNATIRRQPDFRSDDESLETVGKILLDILRTLYNEGKTSLANSIWSSIRREICLGKSRKELPDDVVEFLADKTLTEDPFASISLDWNDKESSYYQMWLVRRVMNDGFIWAGRGLSTYGSDEIDELTQRAEPEAEPQPEAETKAETEAANHESQVANPQDAESTTRKTTIIGRLQHRQLLSMMIRVVDGQTTDETSSTRLSSGAMVSTIMQITEPARNDLRRKQCAFNVNGPCLVATPFDPDFERLPRPSDRGMRVCWVVEAAPKPGLGPDERIKFSPAYEELKADEVSRPFSYPEARTGRHPWCLNGLRYRVKSKVEGFWPIVEDGPLYSYLFV